MFRQVATEVALGMHGLNDRIVDAVHRDDLDAGAVDCILQIILLGEVAYS
jgi:hypothetical protein